MDVCAHITGTVWKVLVKPGDKVEEDQPLAILESMKMEMPLESPEDGTVTELVAQVGQAVEEGDVLLRMDVD